MVKGSYKNKTLKLKQLRNKKNKKSSSIKIKGGSSRAPAAVSDAFSQSKSRTNNVLQYIKNAKNNLEYSYSGGDNIEIDITRRYISLQTTYFNNNFQAYTKLYSENLENKRKQSLNILIRKRKDFNNNFNLYNILFHMQNEYKIKQLSWSDFISNFYLSPLDLSILSNNISKNIYEILNKDISKMKQVKKNPSLIRKLGFNTNQSHKLTQRLINEAETLYNMCKADNKQRFGISNNSAYFTKIDYLNI